VWTRGCGWVSKASRSPASASIVGLSVILLSAIHLSALARVSLEESSARGRAACQRDLSPCSGGRTGRPEPQAALRADPGLRSILESSIYSKSVMYAAITDPSGVAMAHSDRAQEGRMLPPRRDLDTLLDRGGLSQLLEIYSGEGRIFEVRQPLLLGSEAFRLDPNRGLDPSDQTRARHCVQPALATALMALLISTGVALVFAQLMLRPIHVLRSGLSRLGRGELV